MSAQARSKTAAARHRGTAARLGLCATFLLAAAALPADSFHFSADTVTMKLAEGAQHALLTGNARVETQDLRITADQIELFGKDFIYAQCHGGVHVVDAKRGLDLTSEDLFYDRDLKIARVRGNAVMADVKNEIVAKGGFIEDRDNEQLTIIQIGVRIFKNDIECKAEFARYYRDRKVLELSGMPWVSKGTDTYVGAKITINLDTEEISAEGGVQGQVQEKGNGGGAGGSDTGSSAGASGAGGGSPGGSSSGTGSGTGSSGDSGSGGAPSSPSSPSAGGATHGQ